MSQFALFTSTLSALVFGGVWMAAGPAAQADKPAPQASTAPVYYPGCNAVRSAGKAPLYRGQPGYRLEMDGDSDGIACEPLRAGGNGNGRYADLSLRARGRR